MALLTPEVGLLFWMTLSFLLAFAILAMWAFPAIGRMVGERTQYIEQSLEAARRAEEELSGVSAQSAEIMLKAQKEYAETIQKAIAERGVIISQAEQQAVSAARAKIIEAEQIISAERDAALRGMVESVAMLSVDIAEKILREKLSDTPQQMQMINKMLDEVASKTNQKS